MKFHVRPVMKRNLEIIGLSGGIATGKSTCVGIFQCLLPECVVFDADISVKRLYASRDVREQLTEYFGQQIVLRDGGIDKDVLRRQVFENLEAKAFLESVFHPKVREECLALLEKTSKRGMSRLFVADIPLLFENGFDFGQSANLLVTTHKKTQIERLKNRNAWSDKTMQAVVAAQMPLENKILLADVVFWNEGPVEVLKNQCHRFLRSLDLF